jgi:hypothetical protein
MAARVEYLETSVRNITSTLCEYVVDVAYADFWDRLQTRERSGNAELIP